MPAGNAGGNTTRTCQCSRDSIMALQDLAAALKLAPRSGPARRAAPLALPGCSWSPGSLVELCPRPTESPQVRVCGVVPHRIPTDETAFPRSEEHTSELQSLRHLVCRLLL